MTRRTPLPAFLVAGARSGCGKTTLSLAVMAALRRRGLVVQACKTGPDFLDPSWHAAVTGRPSYNLDAWMHSGMPAGGRAASPSLLGQWARAMALPADAAVVEGAMGLFDGLPGHAASCADVACLLDLPVLLVLDARGTAATAAAMAHGLATFRPGLPVLGVACTFVGGSRHADLLRGALAEGCPDLPVFGLLPRDDALALPSRHLGLMAPGEALTPALAPAFLQTLAERAEAHIDLDGLLERARRHARRRPPQPSPPPVPAGERVPVAIARDEAFSFWYPEHDALLEAAGAKLLPFSPLRDAGLPDGARGLILPGGYPELHAERLSANHSLRAAVRNFAQAHPVYAECGGYLFLMNGLEKDGRRLPLCGCLPLHARLEPRRAALGYREVRGLAGPWRGLVLRGHEFHYSRVTERPDALPALWSCTSPAAADDAPVLQGASLGHVSASYVHLAFLSHPLAAPRFVEACRSSA